MFAEPVAKPVTRPAGDMVAKPGALVLQVPLPDASVKESVEPTQTELPPEIGRGAAFTVTNAVSKHPPVVV